MVMQNITPTPAGAITEAAEDVNREEDERGQEDERKFVANAQYIVATADRGYGQASTIVTKDDAERELRRVLPKTAFNEFVDAGREDEGYRRLLATARTGIQEADEITATSNGVTRTFAFSPENGALYETTGGRFQESNLTFNPETNTLGNLRVTGRRENRAFVPGETPSVFEAVRGSFETGYSNIGYLVEDEQGNRFYSLNNPNAIERLATRNAELVPITGNPFTDADIVRGDLGFESRRLGGLIPTPSFEVRLPNGQVIRQVRGFGGAAESEGARGGVRGTIDQYLPQLTFQGSLYESGSPTVDVGPVYLRGPDEIAGRKVYRPTNTLVNSAQVLALPFFAAGSAIRGGTSSLLGVTKSVAKTVGRESAEESGEEALQSANEALYRGGTFPGLGTIGEGGIAGSTSYGGGFSESALRGLSQTGVIGSYAIEFLPGGPRLTKSNAGSRSQIDQYLSEQGYRVGGSQINPQTLYSPFQDVQSRFGSLTPSRRDAALNTATQQLALRPPDDATPASSYRTAPSQFGLAPLGATDQTFAPPPGLAGRSRVGTRQTPFAQTVTTPSGIEVVVSSNEAQVETGQRFPRPTSPAPVNLPPSLQVQGSQLALSPARSVEPQV